jgi:protocatechuate 3,4-dioxygenase beta subunit
MHLMPGDSGTLSSEPGIGTAVTDASGNFMFLGVPAGSYVIQTMRIPRPTPRTQVEYFQAIPPPGAPPPPRPAPAPATQKQEPALYAAQPVTVGGSDLIGLSVILREGVTVTGRVEFVGALERPTAAQLSQISVMLEPADGQFRQPNDQTTRLSPGGTFSVSGRLPGKYLVRMNAPGGWILHSAMVQGIDAADTPLELSTKDVGGMVVTFTDRLAALRGSVRDTTGGSAAVDAAIILFPAEPNRWTDTGFSPRRLRRSQLTSAQNPTQYGFGGLPAGDYYVIALRDDDPMEWQNPQYLELLSRFASRVSLGEAEQRVFDLSVQDVKVGGTDSAAVATRPSTILVPTVELLSSDEAIPLADGSSPREAGGDAGISQQARDRLVADKPGAATISGTVIDDQNGQPIRKARVSIRGQELRSERVALTDDDGRFAVGGLPPGQFTVMATKPAYLSAYHGSRRPGRGPGRPMAVAAGAAVHTLTLRMARGGVITGTVLGPYGLPLQNARVRLQISQQRDGERVWVSSGPTIMSDDRGVYRLFGLQPGTYLVSALPANSGTFAETRQLSDDDMRAAMQELQTPPPPPPAASGSPPPPTGPVDPMAARRGGPVIAPAPPGPLPPAPRSGRAVVLGTVYYPGTVVEQEATPVEVTVGQEVVNVNIPVVYVPASRVEGRVTMADGTPPAARVQITLMTSTPNATSSFPVRTNTDGTFQALSVQPGRYALVARVMHTPAAVSELPGAPPVPASGPSTLAYWAQEELLLSGEEERRVALVLREAFDLAGAVKFEGKNGTPLPDAGRVRVMLEVVGQNRGGFFAQPANVDEQGHFTLKGVTPGRYRINAAPFGQPGQPAAPAWFVKSVTVDGAEAYETPFEITADRTPTRIAVVMTDLATEVSGTITTAGGAPVTDVTMLLFSTNKDLWSSTTSRRVRPPVRPDRDGKYRFASLLPGEYFLAVVQELEPGEWGDPQFMAQLTAAAIRLSVTEGEKKVQNIRTGGQ